MENQNEMELNLLDLFYYLKKKLWIICGVAAVCAVAGFLVSLLLMAPEYTAVTRMYVLNRTNEASVVYADIQTSTYLLKDYEVLITGRNVTKEVIEILDLADVTPEKLANKIEVTAPDNTRVLQINVTESDPKLAADIANCVREVAAEQIQEIMDVDAVKLVYEADVPEKQSGPNVMGNTVIAAALGLVATTFVLVVLFMLDDAIRTEEDVERHLGLSTLGVIPMSNELEAPGTRQKSGRASLGAKKKGA